MVGDQQFQRYIEAKENDYNEGTDFTPDKLMELAQSKYQSLTEAGLWKRPTAEEERIVALTTQLEALKKKRANQPKDGRKGDKDKNAKEGKDKDKWYLQPPKDGQMTRKHGKKTYHWCPNHGEKGKWVVHNPKDCRLKKKDKADNAPNAQAKPKDNSDNPPAANDKKLKVVSFQAGMASDNDDF